MAGPERLQAEHSIQVASDSRPENAAGSTFHPVLRSGKAQFWGSGQGAEDPRDAQRRGGARCESLQLDDCSLPGLGHRQLCRLPAFLQQRGGGEVLNRADEGGQLCPGGGGQGGCGHADGVRGTRQQFERGAGRDN